MPEMISKTTHEYAGRTLSAGDRFECEAMHVALLVHLGRAVPAEHMEHIATATPAALRNYSAGPAAAYRTRDMRRKEQRRGAR